MTFQTRYLFDENARYYITFDDGVAVGVQSCGPVSAGVELADFWVVYTGVDTDNVSRSIRPRLPLLTVRLTSSCRVLDERRPVSCAFDAGAGSACLVESPDVLLTLDCVGSAVSLTHVTPAFHALHVVATAGLPPLVRLDDTQLLPVATETSKSRGWTSWSEWSGCSRSCDAGLQQRVRRCRDGRGSCVGDSTNIRFCSVHYCAQGDCCG